jgi:hypothetical protein
MTCTGRSRAHAGAHDRGKSDTPVVEPILPPVEPAHVLAEELACSVKCLGTLQTQVVDGIRRQIKPKRCRATGDDDSFHIQQASGLEDMKRSHRIGVKGGWRILLRRQGEHGAQVVNHLGAARSHRVQNMAEDPDVTLHDRHAIANVFKPLPAITDIKKRDVSASTTDQHTRDFCADKTRAACDQSAHFFAFPMDRHSTIDKRMIVVRGPAIAVPTERSHSYMRGPLVSSLENRVRVVIVHRLIPGTPGSWLGLQFEHPTLQVVHVFLDRE